MTLSATLIKSCVSSLVAHFYPTPLGSSLTPSTLSLRKDRNFDEK